MEVSDKAMDLIADLGYDPQFGARPLKRVIEKELVNELAKQVLLGEFVADETIYIGTDAKGFTFSETKRKKRGKPVKISTNANIFFPLHLSAIIEQSKN